MPTTPQMEEISEILPESPAAPKMEEVAEVLPAHDEIAEVLPGDAPKEFSIDDFRNKPEAELEADQDFNPVLFGVQNRQAIEADPSVKEKLARVYRTKETKGTTIGQKLKSIVTGTPKAIGAIAEGAGTALGKVLDLNPIALAARVAGGASAGPGGLDTELKRIAGEEAEIPAAIETGFSQSGDLLRRGIRAGKEIAGKVLPGVSSKAELSDKEWQDRLESDLAAAKYSQDAGKGSGAVVSALGVDSDSLKDIGIKVNPNTIQELSNITDPMNFIPIGASVGVVSKIGGKLGTRLVAATLTAEQAAKLAKTLNRARDVVAKTSEVAENVAGKTIEGVGKTVERAGEIGEKAIRSVGGVGTGTALGAILGHSIYSTLGGAAVAKGAPRLVQATGRALQTGGEILQGTRAASPALQVAGQLGKSFAAGAAEGGVLSIPFILGARPDEEEAILGAVGLGGIGHAVATAVPMVGRAAQNKLAESIFKEVELADSPKSETYGTDPNLDTIHEATAAKLDPNSQKLLNWTREAFRDSGVEIYALDDDAFTRKAGTGDAYGFSVNLGERLAPDGTTSPILQIYLNGSTQALPHELFHTLSQLDPEGAKALSDSVLKSWTPREKEYFSKLYNTLRNGGAPESAWKHRLNDEGIAEEAGAEVFSRLFLAQDLSNVAPNITQKAATFASSILEKLGAPLGKIVPPGTKETGVSTLGIRPGAEPTKVGQEFLSGIASRLQEGNGSLLKETRQGSKLIGNSTPEDLAIVKTPPAPVASPVVTPPTPVTAKPKTPAATPVKPAITVRNIRVTREQQNAFSAKRAAETGVEAARPAADKLTPEAKANFETISKNLTEGGSLVEIEHSGVKTEETGAGRTSRRAEQEAAYIAEGTGAAPESVREALQKTFVPVRWETVKGAPQLLAMSLDKVIANVHRVIKDSAAKGVADKIPYEVTDGKLTDNGWGQVVDDLQAYSANQANGYRGDGKKLVRPKQDIGVSIPAENSTYNPIHISEERANFLNLVQGLNPPQTARAGKGTPGNVKGQILAELQGRTPETPTVIRPEDIKKQEFTQAPGRSIKETNPLRNELAAAGVPVRELIEVTERINAKDILKVAERPDLKFNAPVTDVIRAGFLPAVDEKFLTGQAFKDFFSNVTKGEFGKSEVPWVPLKDISNAKDFWTEVQKHSGNFDEHIAKSIPGYRETQLQKGNAIVKSYPEGARVLDIGGSEGSWDKSISQLSDGKIETLVVDPNPSMAEFFRTKSEVPGADYVEAAWGRGFEDEGKTVPKFDDAKKFDVINESMVFQFISPERTEQVREAKRLLKDDGVFLTDEKLRTPEAEWKANETKKDAEYKKVYFSDKELSAKDKVVGFQQSKSESKAVGMVDNMAKLGDYESLLKNNFKFVAQYWDSGNFKGYAASDNLPKLQKFLRELGDTKTEFSTVETPRYVEGKALPAGKSLDEYGKELIELSPSEWQKTTESWDGGLTSQAYRLGLDATDRQYVDTLARLRDEASAKFKETMASGDLDAALPLATKAQFFSEAYGAATGGKSARNGLKKLGFDESKIPFPEGVEGKALPKTEAGKNLAEKGFDFDIQGKPGNREVVIKKGDDIIGSIQSSQVKGKPEAVEIHSASIRPKQRRKGAAEAGYRELLTTLKDDGVKEVTGMMISRGPLEIRKKIFGDFKKLEGPEGEISIDEARDILNQNETNEFRTGVEVVNEIGPDAKFLPAVDFPKNVDPVEKAAIRLPSGRVFTGDWHGDALMKFVDAVSQGLTDEKPPKGVKTLSDMLDGEIPEGYIEDGFVTRDGEFLNRAQALDRAEQIGQLNKDSRPGPAGFRKAGVLESSEFQADRKFLPGKKSIKRDEAGRPLTKGGLVDYNLLVKEMLASRKSAQEAGDKELDTKLAKGYYEMPKAAPAGKLTGWILPDGKFVNLDAAFHEDFLANNSEKLNKQFGTKFGNTADVAERLDALNNGFVRVRYTDSGVLRVELNAAEFPKAKKQILKQIGDNAEKIDGLQVTLLNDKGGQVDSVTVAARDLNDVEESKKFGVLEDAVNSLRSLAAK